MSASLGTSSEAVSVYWNAVAGATFYRVWRAESADGEKALLRDWHAGLTFSDATAEPEKRYHYFIQAAKSATGDSASGLSVGVIGWRAAAPTSVKVTFDAAGGTVATESASFDLGQTYGELPTPTYAGRVFLGWHTAATGGSRIDATCAVRADVTALHAHWIADNEPRVENLVARQRYPWNGYVDVSFGLAGVPDEATASVALLAKNETDAVSLKSFVGAAPTNLTNGAQAFVWDSAKDTAAVRYADLSLAATVTIDERPAGPEPPSGEALAAALDCAGLVFATDAEIGWTVDANGGYDGGACARSGSIGDGGSTTLRTEVDGPGVFIFRWKTSCEETYDRLSLVIDGTEADSISGETDWTVKQVTLTDGTHVIEWIYAKDGAGFEGKDCAWVDAVIAPLGVPGCVSAGDGTATASVKVTWTAVAGATSYVVYRGTTSDAASAEQIGISATASYTDRTAGIGVMYWYFVAASDGTRTSIRGVGDSGYRAFAVPTNVVADDARLTFGVRITWSAVDGAVTYDVYRGITVSGSAATKIGATVEPGFFDSSAVQGVTYYYFVKAVSFAGVVSAFSTPCMGSRKAGMIAPYLVVDLSSGTTASSYALSELSSVPSGGWTDEYKTSKLVLRRIEPGEFMMGSLSSEVGRHVFEDRHQVTLTNAFYMGVFEVTQRQWELVMGSKPSYFSNPSYYATRPVEQVSYEDVRGSLEGAEWPASSAVDGTSFIGNLREKTGLWNFDLPTEAQWEYACRAGTTTALNRGKSLTSSSGSDANMAEVGRYGYNSGHLPDYEHSSSCDTARGTAKAGSYLPNFWGLYDMHGNVCEWCLDWWVEYLGSNAVYNPVGEASGRYRSRRGGSWCHDARYCRSAYRAYYYPSSRDSYCGFRLCSPLGLETVLVTFDACGGSMTVSSQVYAIGSKYTSLPVATNENYCFAGWFTAASGGTQVTSATTVSASVTKLYAQWKELPYMIVDLSGGTNVANYAVSYLEDVPPGGWTSTYKTTKLVLRRIDPGTFLMGSPAGEVGRSHDETQHSVTISKTFYMGIFQVTQKQYELVMGSNPSSYKGDARPVECVSYNMIRGILEGETWPTTNTVDATSFMGKIRARTSLAFDLPTEAQWEYACRAGTTTALNSGKNLTSANKDANMAAVGRYGYNNGYFQGGVVDGKGGYNSNHTTVGSYQSNAWGLYDMHGNVWEWCLDRYASSLGTSAVTDPVDIGSGSSRVLRGGRWYGTAGSCRSASRCVGGPSSASDDAGFRLCSPAGQ